MLDRLLVTMLGHFILSRADGWQRVVSGYIHAPPPPASKTYQPTNPRGALPRKVDLRPYMTAVEDQGGLSSCTANAVAGAYEYLVKRHLKEDAYDVSRLFIYYNARRIDHTEHRDNGSVISSAIRSLKENGACSEHTWAYNPSQVNTRPWPQAYEEAARFTVDDTHHVPVHLDTWKRCLAEGYPIIFGLALYGSFDSHRQRGLVPAPSPREAARQSHGGHAMLCVGYSDPDNVFIVRNSWGTDWGDEGYCYIPYSYLMDPQFNFGDSWIIRRLENLEFDQNLWVDDDKAILPDLDTELASMSAEDYQDLLDAMGDTPLETRIALILLHAAGADGNISDDELEGIKDYMQHTLDALGVEMSAIGVLRHAVCMLFNIDLLHETVALFNDALSKRFLASLLADVEQIASLDGAEAEEMDFVAALAEAWQIHGDEVESQDEEEQSYGAGEEEGEDLDAVQEAMGDFPMEYRIGLLLLQAACVDDDLADEELEQIAQHLEIVLDGCGIAGHVLDILHVCLQQVNNEELVHESVYLLRDHLQHVTLEAIMVQMVEVMWADGELSDEERNLLEILADVWEIQLEG